MSQMSKVSKIIFITCLFLSFCCFAIFFIFNGTRKNIISGIEIVFNYRMEGDSLFLKSDLFSEKENTFTIDDNILTINNGVAGTPYIK